MNTREASSQVTELQLCKIHYKELPCAECAAIFAPRLSVEPTRKSRQAAVGKPIAGVEPAQRQAATGKQFQVLRADQIRPKRLEWLWAKRVPLGRLTTFAGLPGEGKSLVTVDMAARVTKGVDFGDGAGNTLPPSDVLFISSEDDLEDTLVPRLMAADADLKRVHFLKSTLLNGDRLVALDEDLSALKECLTQRADIRLIVIDPVTNHLGKAKMNEEQQVRAVLSLLQIPGVAVVIVLHLNKKEGLNALQRVGGAAAFIGAARASWLFATDDNSDLRHMLPLKNNLAPKRNGGQDFTVETVRIKIETQFEDVPHISWRGRSSRSADEVLNMTREKKPQRQQAISFLMDFLIGGPKPASEVETAARRKGISESTLERAKADLGVVSSQAKGQKAGGWLWSLPPELHMPTTARDQNITASRDASEDVTL